MSTRIVSNDKNGDSPIAFLRREAAKPGANAELLNYIANWLEEISLSHEPATTNREDTEREGYVADRGGLDAAPCAPFTTPQNPWREAVIDALVVSFIYEKAHDTDPRKAINDLIAWEQKIALDPKVSSDAAALIEQGRSAGIATLALSKLGANNPQ